MSGSTRSGLPAAEVLLSSESARRVGDVSGANDLLNTEGLVEIDPAAIAAMRARLLIDDNHIDDARAQLAPWIYSTDEEVIASRWYLARATGSF